MTPALEPVDLDEVRKIVEWAIGERKRLSIEGRGTKRAIKAVAEGAQTLSLRRLAGVIEYQPEELVLTAHAATPIAEIEALLAQRNQMLAFEPPDLGAILGGGRDNGSIGGAIACNLSGPRRLAAGAARDHFLGFNAVNGRAERFKSGAKVMKNVTGYDLSKLMAGSRGTLAIMDHLSIKVVPSPESTGTVLLRGHDDQTAVSILCRAMGSPHDVSGAAHLPPTVAARSDIEAVRAMAGAVTALRVEGIPPSVRVRLDALVRELARPGMYVVLDTLESKRLWRELRDARPLWPSPPAAGRELWRVSVPPAVGAQVVARLSAANADVEAQYDWSGGLVWLSLPAGSSTRSAIQGALAPFGGHASPIHAARAVHLATADASANLMALSQRIRESFDPRYVFA